MMPSNSSSYNEVCLSEDKVVETEEDDDSSSFEILILGDSLKGRSGVKLDDIFSFKLPQTFLPSSLPRRMLFGIALRAKVIRDDCSWKILLAFFSIYVAMIIAMSMQYWRLVTELMQKEIVNELAPYIRTEWGYELSMQVEESWRCCSCRLLLTRLPDQLHQQHGSTPPLWQHAEKPVDGEITVDVRPGSPWSNWIQPRALQGHASVDFFSWGEVFWCLNYTTWNFYATKGGAAFLSGYIFLIAMPWLAKYFHVVNLFVLLPLVPTIMYYSLVYGSMHVLHNQLEALTVNTRSPFLLQHCEYGVEYKMVPGRFFGFKSCQLRLFPAHGFRENEINNQKHLHTHLVPLAHHEQHAMAKTRELKLYGLERCEHSICDVCFEVAATTNSNSVDDNVMAAVPQRGAYTCEACGFDICQSCIDGQSSSEMQERTEMSGDTSSVDAIV